MSSERKKFGDDRFVVGLAVLAAAAVLSFRLGWQGYWWDEDVTLMFVREGWRALLVDSWAFDTHRPVYYGLQKAWIEVFGENPWAIRAFPVFVSLLMLPVFYLVAKRLPAGPAPMTVLMLMVTFPIYVHFARDLRMYGLLHLALAVSLLLMAHLIHRKERRGPLWVAFAVAMAIAFYFHPLAILTATLYGLWCLVCVATGKLSTKFLLEGLCAAAFFLLLIVPAISPFLSHLSGTLGGGTWLYPEVTPLQVYYQTAAAYPYPRLLKIPIALLLAWGLYRLPKQDPLALLIAVQMVGLPLLVLAISQYSPIFLTRTFAWGSMAGLLVLAYGIASIRRSEIRWGLIAGVVAAQLVWLSDYYPKMPDFPYTPFEETFDDFDPTSDTFVLGNQWREPALRWVAPQLFAGKAYGFAYNDLQHGVVDPAYRSVFVPRSDVSLVEPTSGRLFVLIDLIEPAPEGSVRPALRILTKHRVRTSSKSSGALRLDVYEAVQ